MSTGIHSFQAVIDLTNGERKVLLPQKVIHDVQQIGNMYFSLTHLSNCLEKPTSVGPKEYIVVGETHNSITAPSVFLATLKEKADGNFEVTNEVKVPGAQGKVDELIGENNMKRLWL